MKKEDKILEELRKRVLERESEISREQEIKNLKDATKEALTDLTSLSKEEVDAIFNQIEKERAETALKRNKKIRWASYVLGAIALVILFIFYKEATKPPPPVPVLFTENFEDPATSLFEDRASFKYRRTHAPGMYIHEIDDNGQCYWDSIPLAFPAKFTAELRVKWLKGRFDTYGFMLGHTNSDYVVFQIKNNEAAAIGRVDGKWDSFKYKSGFIEAASVGVEPAQVRIEVDGKKFGYFVNGQLVEEGNFDRLGGGLTFLALRACGMQSVGFEHVLVKDAAGNTLFEDNFEEKTDTWRYNASFSYEFYHADGAYLAKTSDSGSCYRSLSSLPPGIDPGNFFIEASAGRLSGETSTDFGLVFKTNDSFIYNFFMNANREALIAEWEAVRKYTYKGTRTTISAGPEGRAVDAVHRFRAEFRDGKEIKFFVNGIPCGTFILTSPKAAVEFGVVTCGLTTCAFDDYHIGEL